MTQLTFSEVEEWLDAHPELSQDYFLRKTDLSLVNNWLVAHGFLTINDYVSGSSRRGSDTSGNVSPNGSYPDDTQNPSFPPGPTILPRRNSSKRCLRHDFARSKSRSVYRTHEVGLINKDAPSSSSRRSSLKDMRK